MITTAYSKDVLRSYFVCLLVGWLFPNAKSIFGKFTALNFHTAEKELCLLDIFAKVMKTQHQ
jgi:hypothetical protein